MDFLETIFLGILGIASGFTVSGGVFTALLAVGLIPRFAGKTHTGKHILLYEEMVVCGSSFGAIISVFFPFIRTYEWFPASVVLQKIYNIAAPFFLGIYGLFAGIFVGCLALAIAEMLDTIPILQGGPGFVMVLGLLFFVWLSERHWEVLYIL